MKKASLLFAFLIFIFLPVSAQDLLRKKAETSPLDAALYLLSKDKDALDAAELARAFFEVGRFDDALRAIDFEQNSYSKFTFLAFCADKLVEQNKPKQTDRFLMKAFAVLRDELEWSYESSLGKFVSNLIKSGRAEQALEIISHQEDDDDRAELLIAAADAFRKHGQPEKAKSLLPEALKLAEKDKDSEKLLQIAALFAELKQPEKSKEIIRLVEPSAFSGQTEIEAYNNRRKILFPFLKTYLALGDTEKAFEIWNRHGDSEDFYEYERFINDLIAHGQKEKALFLIDQMQTDKAQLEREGWRVVEAYLKIGDTETALDVAKRMSNEIDNSGQQEALMKLADKFIAEGRREKALEILDFAFQRARRIVYEHGAMDSVGASPGSRKEIYLGEIYKRYVKLGEFEKAFGAFNAIDKDHEFAKDFFAGHLIDFAERQIKTLPRRKIYELINEAQNAVKDEDEDEDENYESMRIKLRAAEIYARMGEKPKAVRLIAEVLRAAKESCCYEDDFLLSAGKVFETQKLKADADLRKVLRKFWTDSEE